MSSLVKVQPDHTSRCSLVFQVKSRKIGGSQSLAAGLVVRLPIPQEPGPQNGPIQTPHVERAGVHRRIRSSEETTWHRRRSPQQRATPALARRASGPPERGWGGGPSSFMTSSLKYVEMWILLSMSCPFVVHVLTSSFHFLFTAFQLFSISFPPFLAFPLLSIPFHVLFIACDFNFFPMSFQALFVSFNLMSIPFQSIPFHS